MLWPPPRSTRTDTFFPDTLLSRAGDAIVADIGAGFSKPAAVVVERDRRKAIARAVGEAGADDIVLIAGKGHETYQEVAGARHPFDDGQVAREMLEGRA